MKIALTQGKFAIIDDEDTVKIQGYNWMFNNGYAVATGPRPKRERIWMHRLIVGRPSAGYWTDHINGIRTDNRKVNLRFVTKGQNAQNRNKAVDVKSSLYKGVSLVKRDGTWRAAIKLNAKPINLGLYTDELDAALAYNQAALCLFGETAKLNDIGKHQYAGTRLIRSGRKSWTGGKLPFSLKDFCAEYVNKALK